MEDDLNLLSKIEDNLNFFRNGRRPHFLSNGREPKFFGKGRQSKFFGKWKTI